MNFDPTQPYGTIRGQTEDFPTARFTQGLFVYDNKRVCLNASKVIEPPPESPQKAAGKTLEAKLEKAADAALLALDKAKAALEKNSTSANKGKYTKAVNAYEKAQNALEDLAE